MSERVSFGEMLSFGFRTLFWRPLHSLILIAIVSAITFAYFAWAQSPSGIAWTAGYMEASLGLSVGDYGPYLSMVGTTLIVSILANSIYYCGIYRVMLREDPKPWLPFQLGADEARFVLLVVVFVAVGIVSLLGVMLVILIVGFVLGLLTMGGSGPMDGVLTAVLGLLALVLMVFPMTYVLGRFAVSFPLSIKQRRLSLGGWSASKGLGWSLVGAHILLYIVILVVQFILMGDVIMANFEMAASGQSVLSDDYIARLANPYGDLLYPAVPVLAVLMFVLLGPTAAIAAKAGSADT